MRISGERGIVSGSMIRLLVFLLVLGVALIETASVIFTRLQVQDAAEAGAIAGAATFRDTGDLDAARAAVERDVSDKLADARVESVELLDDGRIRAVVRKKASTMLVHRFSFSRHLAIATGRSPAHPPAV